MAGPGETPPGAPRPSRGTRLSALAMAVLLDAWFIIRGFLTAVLMCWAGVLALPGDTFAHSTGYDWFAARAPEEAWAAGFGVAAAVCGSALVYREAWWRMASALAASVAFGVIAYGIGSANRLSPGAYVYICCALLSYGLVLRNAASRPGLPEHRGRAGGGG